MLPVNAGPTTATGLPCIKTVGAVKVETVARWQTLDHALPAFVLAGRLEGLTEDEIKAAWVHEDRESVLGDLADKKRRKK